MRISKKGSTEVLLDGIPSGGSHFTNRPVVGRDRWIYFSQDTITNSGVLGPDSVLMGWVDERPHLHDVLARDIALRGVNFLMCVNPRIGEIHHLACNTGAGPASLLRNGGLERPLDARFDPTQKAMYVTDFRPNPSAATAAWPQKHWRRLANHARRVTEEPS